MRMAVLDINERERSVEGKPKYTYKDIDGAPSAGGSMNGLTVEQIDKIKARLDALESIQGSLSRVRTLGDKDWRLGCIYNHTAYPLNDDQAASAWSFVEHAPDDIAALLAHIDALEAELAKLRRPRRVVELPANLVVDEAIDPYDEDADQTRARERGKVTR